MTASCNHASVDIVLARATLYSDHNAHLEFCNRIETATIRVSLDTVIQRAQLLKLRCSCLHPLFSQPLGMLVEASTVGSGRTEVANVGECGVVTRLDIHVK